MMHALWKYILSVLLFGCSWGNSAVAHVHVKEVALSSKAAKDQLSHRTDAVHEHPIDLVETTVSLKYSVIFIDVPQVHTKFRIPDHLHGGNHYFSERLLLPPKLLYLHFQVFRI
jgi:hypothetical protein